MIEENLSVLSNYLWKQSIENINNVIGDKNKGSFTNTDYFNLSKIYYLKKPQFTQIAEELNVTKPAVSLIVKRLMALDLVERIQSEEDKRVYFVRVTEKGKQIVGGDVKEYEKLAQLIRMHSKSEEEYAVIDSVIEKVVNSIKELQK